MFKLNKYTYLYALSISSNVFHNNTFNLLYILFYVSVLGVFARKLIQQRTQFGPFIAPRVPKLEIIPPDNKLIFKVIYFLISINPNSLDNKGSWRILKDFCCSVTMLGS